MAAADKKGFASERARKLLSNVIRHTDAHNRRLEEAEMWNLREKRKEGYLSDHVSDGRPKINRQHKETSDVKNSFLYDDRESGSHIAANRGHKQLSRRAHMDEDSASNIDSKIQSGSTFWLRELYKAKEEMDDRWGHAGYKELYPKDFESDRSGDSDETTDSSSGSTSSSSPSRKRKNKRKASSSRDSNRKKKRRRGKEKKKKEKKKKKDKKTAKRNDSSSSSDGSDDIDKEDSRKKKRRKEKDSERDKDLDEKEEEGRGKSYKVSQSPSQSRKKKKRKK